MSDNRGTIIVTAGCGGIGAEITNYLLGCNYFVILTTRDEKNGRNFVRNLELNKQKNCISMQLDLEDQNKIDYFISNLHKKNCKIDALINCAVCRKSLEDAYELAIEKWIEHYRVNVFGTAYLSAQVAEKLIIHNGSIVNISSFYSINVPDDRVYDKETIPTSLIYASSKAALNYVTKYMAVKYADQNINVNAILAGGVENPARQSDFFVDNYCYRTPMKRMAHIDEFNQAVEFFISDNSKYCTGQLLSIDGGWGLL